MLYLLNMKTNKNVLICCVHRVWQRISSNRKRPNIFHFLRLVRCTPYCHFPKRRWGEVGATVYEAAKDALFPFTSSPRKASQNYRLLLNMFYTVRHFPGSDIFYYGRLDVLGVSVLHHCNPDNGGFRGLCTRQVMA